MGKIDRQWEVFASFIMSSKAKRLEQLDEYFGKKHEYEHFFRQVQVLYEQLEDALPEKHKTILMKFTDILSNITTLQQNFFYEYGFMDSIRLTQKLMK